ncbi:MAG: hypothetical protein IKN30_03090, partial [Synergistaceae bacterium]|nr:hypothetical protein [Synergistaceae bacterium]
NIKISNDVPEGYFLVWHPFTRSVTGTLVEDAASESSYASFYNSKGELVEVVPSDKIINVSAWLDSGELYAPVISAVESGDKIALASSSGGCNSGIESLAVIISACALVFRRKGER